MHPPRHHHLALALLLALSALQPFTPSAFSSPSPHATLRPLPYDSVQWTTGFWADRHQQLATVTLPEMWRLLADPDAGHVLENFRLAATVIGAVAPIVNREPRTVNPAASGGGAYAGTNWQDEWLYKWIEAASCIWRTTRDPWILDRINESIALIAAAQQPDGYLSTKIIAGKLPRFTNPNDHEFYNMGHLLTAAAVHHRMTGDTALLDIARKTADYACATLGVTVEPFVAHNPSIVMGLVDIYRITGEKRYLDTAQLVVDRRGTKPRLPIPPQGVRAHVVPGSDLIQDRVPVRKSTEFVGQNVFSTYLYAGAADIVAETGERELDEALHRLWRNLTETKMYVHGGISALARGVSAQHIVTESAGRPHDLPNTHGYNETCGQIGVFMWAARMLQNNPDSAFADTMELELYNGFLGGIGLDGKSWFYRNVLRRYDKDYKPATQETGPLTDMAQRTQPGRRNICCPTNLLRTFAELSTHFYSADDTSALWIHQYGGSRASLNDLTIEQITDYPWNGDIRILIKSAPAQPATLHLRIPEWAAGHTLTINGQPVAPLWSAVAERSGDTALSDSRISPACESEKSGVAGLRPLPPHSKAAADAAMVHGSQTADENRTVARERQTVNREPQTVNLNPSGYATLTRTFKPGDTITLTLPMPARLLEANPAIEQTRNQVAIKRGPLIYCLESPDIPADTDIRDISLPAAARFTTDRGIITDPANSAGQPLADQIVTLKTTALDRPAKQWDTLYRDLNAAPSAPVSIELIPYFSWSNRGPSAMSVWIPLATAEKISNPEIPNPK